MPLEGHEALRDTMEDLMLDFAGSLIISVIGYFDLKKQRKGIAALTLDTDSTEDAFSSVVPALGTDGEKK